MDEKFEPGDQVRYTMSAYNRLRPPSLGVVGTVVEAEYDWSIVVDWPMGRSVEDPKDLRKAKAGA